MPSLATGKLDALVEALMPFEANPRSIDVERLLGIHRDLLEAYPLLRGNREQATELEARFEHYLRQMEVGASTLRQVLLQFHITIFNAKVGAGLDLRSAYNYALSKRGEQTADGPYARFVCVPRILDPINMLVRPRVRLELLASVARHIEIEMDAPKIFEEETREAELNELPLGLFVLGLVRRWEESGRENLANRGHTVENRLFHLHAFESMARENEVLGGLLTLLGYVRRPSFWQRIGRWFKGLAAWVVSQVVAIFRGLGASRRLAYVLLGLAAIVAATAAWVWILHAKENSWEKLKTIQAQHQVAPREGAEPWD